MGHGISKSVIHSDDHDNLNCLISGKKRFIIFKNDRKFLKHLPKYPERNEFGFVDEDHPNVKSYGVCAANIDVDRVDLLKYPRWAEVEYWTADLGPGDCLFL